MNLAKNQANGKQIPEANLIFENYSYFSSAFLSKNNRTYFKKTSKGTSLSVFMRLND